MPERESPVTDKAQRRLLYHPLARCLSFTLASVLALLLLIAPFLWGRDASQLNHWRLMLEMWGICAGFVHGVGFIPRLLVWRWLLGPMVAWLLMGLNLSGLIRLC